MHQANNFDSDEHRNRSPDCLFFTYTPQQAPAKMPAKTRGQRTSKASRISSQSAVTVGESLVDQPAEHEDSVMTTASTLTQGGRKAPRAKKAATTAKGRKTRAKKDEVVEVYDAEAAAAEEMPPAPKSTRGRKRKSDEVDGSVLVAEEAPAPKKRGGRGGATNAVDSSLIEHSVQPDVDMVEAKPLKRANSKKKGTKAAGRGSAASTASVTVPAPVLARLELSDDEELQRQLEADFDRPLSDDENLAADSDSERFRRSNSSTARKKAASAPASKKGHQSKASVTSFAMFDPSPVEADEAEVDAELKALEAEMAAEEVETIEVPKKGRKAGGVRKASKQKAKAKAEPESAPVQQQEEAPQPAQEVSKHVRIQEPETEVVLPSVETVPEAPPKRGRGRPPKNSTASTASVEDRSTAPTLRESLEHLPAKARPTPAEPSVAASKEITARSAVPARKPVPEQPPSPTRERPLPAPPGTPRRASGNRTGASRPETAAAPPTETRPTPVHAASAATPAVAVATPSARQGQAALMSPSQSPQSSDAENQPPSSRADLSSAGRSAGGAAVILEAKRVALAPAGAATPVRNNAGVSGYGNGNVVGGLRSTDPWTAADLDLVFASCGNAAAAAGADKENGREGGSSFLTLTKGAALTSPERRMTVEEWIRFNAGLAERQLRMECEAVVSAFEREGSRAMTTLEGLVVD